MAPNYANIFMDKIEQGILNDFYKKYGMKPLIWLRYIDDIFFIWTHGPESFNYSSNLLKHTALEKHEF